MCNAPNGARRSFPRSARGVATVRERRWTAARRPSRAEHGRARPSRTRISRRDVLPCDYPSHSLVFFLFFAPPRRDRPRFARVNARHPRPTGDGASARLPPRVKAPENQGVPPPSPRAHRIRTHARTHAGIYTRTHVYIERERDTGGITVCSCRWCSTGEEAWSVFSAPVSNRHGPLPQPRTQQGELRLVAGPGRRGGWRGRGADAKGSGNRRQAARISLYLLAPLSSPSALLSALPPHSHSAPVPDLLARELSSYGRYYSPRLVGPSVIAALLLSARPAPRESSRGSGPLARIVA